MLNHCKINFDKVSEYLRDVVNPASAHLSGLGIEISEYTFRKVCRQDNTKVTYDMHIFHLTFEKDRPQSYVEHWFKNEFDDEDSAPYIQVNFSSVEGCATALVMI